MEEWPQYTSEDVPTIVFVGRLAVNKRPDEAIEAFRLARKVIPTLRMWVIGSGPMEEKLRKIAPQGVEFLGRISDDQKHQCLARADLLVVTSVREGWGLVVTEAAQCGTVAVGYDVPGLNDSIKASKGFLVPPSPSELAKGIVTALNQNVANSSWRASPDGVIPWKDVACRILSTSKNVRP